MKKTFMLTVISLSILLVSGCKFMSKNIQNDPVKSNEPIRNHTAEYSITPTPVNVEGYEAMSKCTFDITNDESDDTITLYTSAQRDKSGEMLWDDTQEWVLQVETDDGVYDLYDERIHGRAYLNVSDYYNNGNEEKVISLYIAGKSFNEIWEYKIDNKKIIGEIVYSTDNTANEGIGTIYSSIPDYE